MSYSKASPWSMFCPECGRHSASYPREGIHTPVLGRWPPKLGCWHRSNARCPLAHLVLSATLVSWVHLDPFTDWHSGWETGTYFLKVSWFARDRVAVPAQASLTPKPWLFLPYCWDQNSEGEMIVQVAGRHALEKGLPRLWAHDGKRCFSS